MARNWTFNEVTLALYAYCHVPFNKANDSNPWIVKIAQIVNRTPAAVKMKIGNLGAFDPALKAKGITGLTGTSAMDKLVWESYYGHWDKLVEDAERLIAEHSGEISQIQYPIGSEQYILAKRRVNQSFFRESVLAAYNNCCCISKFSDSRLLEACHIQPWSENESLRTDPSNGLCLNSLLHKAYDKMLISIDADLKIHVSEQFLSCCKDEFHRGYYLKKVGETIVHPSKFYPYRDSLDIHHQLYLEAQ